MSRIFTVDVGSSYRNHCDSDLTNCAETAYCYESMDSSPEREYEEQRLREVVGVIDNEIMACGFGAKELQEFKQLAATEYNARNATVSMFSANKRKAQRLADIRRNPYFGRIDFDDLNEKTSEKIYLGAGHIRHKGRDYVHDWRAPVGELFYQSYGGRTTYRAPIGIVPVEIHLKRRLTIQDATLVDFNDTYDGTDPDPAIADSLLAQMLQRSAGTNMGQIVRSIQAEQDAVIRTRGDIVIVQGPAGSGKTVVALHRAAYLLYQMRQSPDDEVYKRASASSMRVFSPNRVFAEYISHVMPDLHEDTIRQDVFDQFLIDRLISQMRADGTARKYTVELKEQHFDTMLTSSEQDYSESLQACREKTSAAVADRLSMFADAGEADVRERLIAVIGEAVGGAAPVLSLLDLTRRFDRRRGEASLIERLGDVIFAVEDETAERKMQLKEGRKPRKPTDPNYHLVLSHRQQEALTAEIDQLTGLLRGLSKISTLLKKKPLVDLYREFWRSEESGPIADRTIESLSRRAILYEDIPALVCLNGFYRGFDLLADTVHAIVDECQDYTPLHYVLLRHCLPPDCTMTIVGDLNQIVDESASLGSYDALADVFPGRTKRLDLTRSYRSSQEITSFASAILGAGTHIDNVRRGGREPEVIRAEQSDDLAESIVRAVEEMRSRDYRQIAVICKSRADAAALYRSIGPSTAATLMTGDSDHIPQGLCVVPIALAKGLEFDAVVVADASAAAYHRDADRRLLYTACTRALHELVVCYGGEPCRFLPASTSVSS